MEKKSLAKLSASKEADESLDRMIHKLNDGFTGGRVTKADLTSWAILFFEKNSFSKSIERLRKDHFSKTAHLKSVLQQLRRGELLEGDLYSHLSPIFEKAKSQGVENKKETVLQSEEKLDVK